MMQTLFRIRGVTSPPPPPFGEGYKGTVTHFLASAFGPFRLFWTIPVLAPLCSKFVILEGFSHDVAGRWRIKLLFDFVTAYIGPAFAGSG